MWEHISSNTHKITVSAEEQDGASIPIPIRVQLHMANVGNAIIYIYLLHVSPTAKVT